VDNNKDKSNIDKKSLIKILLSHGILEIDKYKQIDNDDQMSSCLFFHQKIQMK
jgi:hypothetical protein